MNGFFNFILGIYENYFSSDFVVLVLCLFMFIFAFKLLWSLF